jgi:hypothetical protein
MAKSLVVLALALPALGACLGPAQFRGWQEPPYKFAQCSGAPTGLNACFEQARTMCPEGYQLAELRSDPDINRHSIIVICGAGATPAAPPAAPARRARPAPAPPAK